MNSTAYSIRALLHAYSQKTALDIPLLDIPKGKICALLGPNGSGKTTLLSILAHLLTPTSGSVLLFGMETIRNRNFRIRRKVTMVHQKPILFSTSVRDNIAYGLRATGYSSKEIESRVHRILGELKLEDVAEKHARKLSGGEAQRVALARALVLDLPIVLLDEPTNSLDDTFRPILLETIERINETRNTTFIIATHDLNFLTPIATQIVRLNAGKLESNNDISTPPPKLR
jgi:tungstate transport system ATP-binding protein